MQDKAVVAIGQLALQKSGQVEPYQLYVENVFPEVEINYDVMLAGASRPTYRAHFAFYGWLGTLRSQRRRLAQLATTDVPLFPKSIVWQYFAKGARRFSDL